VENISIIILNYSVRNMVLYIRGCHPIHPNEMGFPKKKNHTLTDLVNAMLDTAGLSKAWCGSTLIILCHVLNRVLMKNKEKTPYEE
jgi:hypothetical protein